MNIINFAYNSWSKYWKRNQTLFHLLSSMDNVESSLFINPGLWLNDVILNPNSNFEKINNVVTKQFSKKIFIKTPLYLPLSYKIKIINQLNFYINSHYITKLFNKNTILILNNLQADKQLVELVRSKSKIIIFDWSDDFVEFSDKNSERLFLNDKCEYFCKISNFIFTINESLQKRALKFNSNSYVIKNATNFFTCEALKNNCDSLKNFRNYGEKVIGYLGWLNSLRLDLELIQFVAEKRPDYSFLFIGPLSEKQPLGVRIPTMKNVYILPAVPYEEYVESIKALDVCILPNLINAHTNGNDPIKIYDYLASGKPIVSTKTAGTETFSGLIYLAENKEEFLKFLDYAVTEKNSNQQHARISAARKNSWQERFNEIQKIIKPHLNSLGH